MGEIFEYVFDQKTGILFKYYFGSISIEDIESSWEYAFRNNIIPENTRRFLLDYRRATMSFTPKEYQKIPQFYQRNINVFRNSKVAIITDSPKDIVIPELVKLKDSEYISMPFSTLEGALQWLLV